MSRWSLGAAHAWAFTEYAALNGSHRPRPNRHQIDQVLVGATPSTAAVRAWVRSVGLEVPNRGRLHPEISQAWQYAKAPNRT